MIEKENRQEKSSYIKALLSMFFHDAGQLRLGIGLSSTLRSALCLLKN